MISPRVTILVALVILAAPAARSDDPNSPVDEHIVSLITDIDSYVAWPEAKADEDKPFFVAVLGDSPLAARIKKLNRTKLPSGRRIRVRTVAKDMLPSNAHLLLITAPEVINTRTLDRLKGTGTLTVSVGDTDLPTVIRIYEVDEEGTAGVRTVLDLERAAAENLDIKKKLEEIAVIHGSPAGG